MRRGRKAVSYYRLLQVLVVQECMGRAGPWEGTNKQAEMGAAYTGRWAVTTCGGSVHDNV